MSERSAKNRGLVIVYTGSGKGKTTAAVGMAVRAAGYGKKTIIIQFIKGPWESGELKSLKKLAPWVKIIATGKGFIKILGDKKPFTVHKQAARRALAEVKKALVSKKYDLVILDEINYALKGGLIAEKDALELIKIKPEYTHLVFTGNYALKSIMTKADLVTEMKEIKHPFKKGILAQKGVDY